ncbi:MAG: type II toxin-antitoxin system PemK/MazF family toxin [Nanoarchaeota archaeon]
MINQGDLLLAPFPFSDQSGRKVRPVIVISNDKYNSHHDDIVAVGVTSNVFKNPYYIDFTNADLDFGNLVTVCSIMADSLTLLDKELITKRIGKVNKNKMKTVFDKVVEIIKTK